MNVLIAFAVIASATYVAFLALRTDTHWVMRGILLFLAVGLIITVLLLLASDSRVALVRALRAMS